MKVLTNKIFSEKLLIEGQPVFPSPVLGAVDSYADLLLVCFSVPPKDGYTHRSMKDRIRIEDAVKEAVEKAKASPGEEVEIAFEDAHAEVAKSLVEEMKWSIKSRSIVDFIDDVTKSLA